MTKETKRQDPAQEPEMEKNPAQTAPDAAQAAEEPAAEAPKEPTAEEKLQAQLDELNDRYLRTLAEYDNYRKRTAKEKDALYPEAKASTLASILPILDSLERALAVPCSDEEFKKGLELIHKSFDEVLQKHGVEAFGEVGDLFDPGMYAAVAHVDDEAAGENSVAEVFQKGYKMGDRILRYAMVKVAN